MIFGIEIWKINSIKLKNWAHITENLLDHHERCEHVVGHDSGQRVDLEETEAAHVVQKDRDDEIHHAAGREAKHSWKDWEGFFSWKFV
jgi:hypothetical protein